MKRPLMVLLVLFMLGELAGQMIQENLSVAIPAACAAAGTATVVIWRSRCRMTLRKGHGMLLLLLFFLGFLRGYGGSVERTRQQKNLFLQASASERVELEGVITEVKEGAFLLDTGEGKVLVWWDTDQEDEDTAGASGEGRLQAGDRVQAAGTLQYFSEESNPGGFDAEAYYLSEGVLGQVTGEEVRLVEAWTSPVRGLLARIRSAAAEKAGEILPEKEAGVLSAMLLGERAGVDQELKELYQRNGIAHILAISGLHVSLLGGAVRWLLLRLRLSGRAASLITILFLLGYGALTGFSPATLRAILMLASVNLAGVFLRVSDLPTAMSLSLFLILLFQPYRITSSGMLMSFLAVAGVMSQQILYRDIFDKERFLFLPVRLRGFMKTLTASVLLSMMIQLFLLPVMIRDYYAMAPYSLLLNLLVVPLLSVAVASGALGLLLAFIPGLSFLGRIAALPCRGILFFYEWLCDQVEKLPGHEVVTGHISNGEMIALLGISVVIVLGLHLLLSDRKRKERKWRYYGAVLAGLMLLLSLYSGGARLRNYLREQVIFYSVGQGDGCVIHTREADILVDFGSTSRDSVGEKILIPGLRYSGITHVDLVTVSHTDADHVNGLAELLEVGEDYGISVGAIAFAAGTGRNQWMDRLISPAEEKGIEVLWLCRGDVLTVGEAEEDIAPRLRLDILYPEAGRIGEGNDHSLVMLLETHGIRILFTGDIGEKVEEELVPVLSGLPPVDMLKTAHHGSAYSSSEEFLAAIGGKDTAAVISCGKNNLYGHPADAALERLSAAGFTVYRTDRNGAVILELP